MRAGTIQLLKALGRWGRHGIDPIPITPLGVLTLLLCWLGLERYWRQQGVGGAT